MSLERWVDWWAPRWSPAAFRLFLRVFCAALLVMSFTRAPLWRWAAVESELWLPTQMFQWLGIGQPSSMVPLLLIDVIFRGALLAMAFGLIGPVLAWAAALAGALWMWLPHCFGKVHHGDALPFWCLLLSAVALTLCWRRGTETVDDGDRIRGAAVRGMQVLIVLVFFAAGMAKLRVTGWSWASADNLQGILLSHQVSPDPLTELGLWVASHPWLCRMAALSGLLFELGAPLALVHRYAALVIVGGLCAMQLINWLMLGVLFATFLPCYLCWLPWRQWAEHVQGSS